MTHKNRKILRNFMFSFDKLKFDKKVLVFSAVFFLIIVLQNPGSGLDPDRYSFQSKMLNTYPEPESINLKHSFARYGTYSSPCSGDSAYIFSQACQLDCCHIHKNTEDPDRSLGSA
jgi:hypothetical protein